MTVRLEELLAAATPGPWQIRLQRGYAPFVHSGHLEVCAITGASDAPRVEEDAALIALVPDAYRLLIDMGAWIESVYEGDQYGKALLARLDRLGGAAD